jgi:hypothetical protein
MRVLNTPSFRLFFIILGSIVIFILGACSTQNAEIPQDSVAANEEVSTTFKDPDSPAETTDMSNTESEDQSASESSDTPQTENDPSAIVGDNTLLLFPDMITMENIMPLQGVGLRPRFEWQTINGAAHYGIIILDPKGSPYWGWRGEKPWVYLGGIDEPLPEINEGPILIDGMSWRIVAYDANEVPIATGGPWAIAP